MNMVISNQIVCPYCNKEVGSTDLEVDGDCEVIDQVISCDNRHCLGRFVVRGEMCFKGEASLIDGEPIRRHDERVDLEEELKVQGLLNGGEDPS